MTTFAITPAELTAALKRAGSTLKRAPIDRNDFVQRVKAVWPDYDPGWLAYGFDDAKTRPAIPTGEELDELDKVLGWTWCLDDDERIIVISISAGWTSRPLSRMLKRRGITMSHTTVLSRYERAITKLLTHVGGLREGHAARPALEHAGSP